MKVFIPIMLAVFIIGCTAQTGNVETENVNGEIKADEVVSMKLTSPAFRHNGKIPSEYTCDGDDISPELDMANVPGNAKSLVLINDDPDAPAGTWDHWIVFNIPPTTTKINKNQEPDGIAGKNSWGRTGYGGPCPPDKEHRYFFKLYALNTELDLGEGASKKEIEKAMEGHIIEKAELIGLYKRV